MYNTKCRNSEDDNVRDYNKTYGLKRYYDACKNKLEM